MKKLLFFLFITAIALYAFSPNNVASGIHGIIDPTDGAKKVWAISGTDTASAIPAVGNFSVDVKPGTWKLIVEAVSPYRNAFIENIVVGEGQSVDAGVIKLLSQ